MRFQATAKLLSLSLILGVTTVANANGEPVSAYVSPGQTFWIGNSISCQNVSGQPLSVQGQVDVSWMTPPPPPPQTGATLFFKGANLMFTNNGGRMDVSVNGQYQMTTTDGLLGGVPVAAEFHGLAYVFALGGNQGVFFRRFDVQKQGWRYSVVSLNPMWVELGGLAYTIRVQSSPSQLTVMVTNNHGTYVNTSYDGNSWTGWH